MLQRSTRSSRRLSSRVVLVLLFGILGPLFAWLFWPLSSPRFRIVDDPVKLAAKQAFLARQASGAPAAGAPDATTAGVASVRRPNIVLILADDLGKTDISLYGSPYIQTPHIDSIGHDGVTFTEGYITTS